MSSALRFGAVLGAAVLVAAIGLDSMPLGGQRQPALASAMRAVAAPLVFDHNRMLVDAEVQAKDGTWRRARLWIDTGNPDFIVSAAFARSAGFDVPEPKAASEPREPAALPHIGVRVNGVPLDFDGVRATAPPGLADMWGTMHADANVPSTVLRRYDVVFDYPGRRLELRARAGSASHAGVAVPARVHPQTGIVQVDAQIGSDRFSFAIDIGAAYSMVSEGLLARLTAEHAGWPRVDRAVGCANMWGLWPQEDSWHVVRVPEIRIGAATIAGVGLAGVPNFFPDNSDLGTWYSQKAAAPVVGFLGPNVFKGFRLEIDYAKEMVYLERRAPDDVHDMDLVGLTIQPANGRWRVIGSAVDAVQPGDILLQVGDLSASGATMGTVVDALRGQPGDVRVLTIERQGKRVRVEARVRRFV